MTAATATPEKVCNACGEAWPADTEFFHREPGNSDGLSCRCKACRAGYDRQRNGTARRRQGRLTQGLQAVFTGLIQKAEQSAHATQ